MERQCPICGQSLVITVQYKNRRTCSRLCGQRLRYGDPKDRFWSNVDQSGGPDACWPWKRSTDDGGYGSVGWQGRLLGSHRVAYFLTHGTWPKDNCLHTCDNPPCCNPKHLYDGTDTDNLNDAHRRGRRNQRGENNGRAVLHESDVCKIRKWLSQGYTQQSIADVFGIAQGIISAIKLKKRWAHVMCSDES
jgi:DNA-binding CsgD family transcriptional regulator